MIKDKLHTISDEDAIKVAEILLKSSTSSIFNFSFDKISRQEYVEQHGVDAEESISVFFNAKVKHPQYVESGWKDKTLWIQIIESDRYHDYPYFCAFYREKDYPSGLTGAWKQHQISNYIEAVEFLQKLELL